MAMFFDVLGNVLFQRMLSRFALVFVTQRCRFNTVFFWITFLLALA